jgi:hypothetical protein
MNSTTTEVIMKNLFLATVLILLTTACSSTFEKNEGTGEQVKNFKVIKKLPAIRSGL